MPFVSCQTYRVSETIKFETGYRNPGMDWLS